jgi:hypothetical protein
MVHSNVDYMRVLDDLKARRAKLNAAITAIEEIVGLAPPTAAADLKSFVVQGPANGSPDEGRTASGFRPFADKTIVAAAADFLRSSGQPQSTNTIVTALKSGGISSHSKNLYRTLYNTLNNNLDKEIMRDDRGYWGLKEWART